MQLIDFKTRYTVKEKDIELYLVNYYLWAYREKGRRRERPFTLANDYTNI